MTLAIDSQHNPGYGTLTCTGGLSVPVTKGVATFATSRFPVPDMYQGPPGQPLSG